MKRRRTALTGFTLALILVFGSLAAVAQRFQNVIVAGDSMEPTLQNGQRVWISNAYWLVGPIQRKDVVVVRDGIGGLVIKRVYWMPGEIVTPDHRSLDLPFLGEWRVPEGHVWLIGDNRSVSEDSRSFGAVPLEAIVGKLVRY